MKWRAFRRGYTLAVLRRRNASGSRSGAWRAFRRGFFWTLVCLALWAWFTTRFPSKQGLYPIGGSTPLLASSLLLSFFRPRYWAAGGTDIL